MSLKLMLQMILYLSNQRIGKALLLAKSKFILHLEAEKYF